MMRVADDRATGGVTRDAMMTSRGSILLVDDEEKILKSAGTRAPGRGPRGRRGRRPREAQRLLAERAFDVLVVDNVMPELSGLEVIRELVASTPEADRPQILMMTAHATVESAIEAMKLGALDYLQKPFEIDELLVVVSPRARASAAARPEPLPDERAGRGVQPLRHRRAQPVDRGRDQDAELVAQSKSTVLITGETGTGKEMVARAIHVAQRAAGHAAHQGQLRRDSRDAARIGAVRPRARRLHRREQQPSRGKFALADGGTIFLDEIGTMSPALQAKLLRVLQDREFEPLGAERTQRVDVRVIAATNRDLRQMVADGRFLEDLFYRLNVIPIEIPPLRERREDIPLLVEHFVRKHQKLAGKRIDSLGDGVLPALQGYDWPGNVRELENTIERAVVLSSGPVITEAADLRDGRAPAPSALPVARTPAERRVGRARNDPPRARSHPRRQEGSGGADGHQPARAQLLPREISS